METITSLESSVEPQNDKTESKIRNSWRRKLLSFLASYLGLFVLLVLYVVGGAYLFYERCHSYITYKMRYSRALHNADFGDKKNQCISKSVYCELLYRDIKKTCICEISAYPLQRGPTVYRFCAHFLTQSLNVIKKILQKQ